MGNEVYLAYVLSCSVISLLVFTSPVFAEVVELRTDKKAYQINEHLTFHGKVKHGDSGLVTIVIRDSHDQFVLLTQATTESDYSFEKTIKIGDKFKNIGNYNATGFILNMTAGITTEFEVNKEQTMLTPTLVEKISHNTETQAENSIQTHIDKASTPKLADFVDPQQDPSYYIERYYNEPEYKSWFDRNYPDYTIEEAVGFSNTPVNQKIQESFSNKEIIPNAEAISISADNEFQSTNNESVQFVLAIAGLAILFAATYGVKRKVDHNSHQISINRDTLKQKILHPIIRTDPINILKVRLAKGEISLQEYNKLRQKLQD